MLMKLFFYYVSYLMSMAEGVKFQVMEFFTLYIIFKGHYKPLKATILRFDDVLIQLSQNHCH